MARNAPNGDEAPEAARDEALKRIFGPIATVLHSPIPWGLGGNADIYRFDECKGIDGQVFCTADLAGGWGSGQKPGPHGEYELVMCLRPRSLLAPRIDAKSGGTTQGFVGSMLCGLAKFSCQVTLKPGETAGPIYPELMPLAHMLFHDLSSPRVPFEFGGSRYGLLLVILITQPEYDFAKKEGAASLIARLKTGGVFPFSDPNRESVV